jgi:hypothetical protein
MPQKTTEFDIKGEGVSPKRIKVLDSAIDDWRGFVENRMALTEKEIEASAKVVDLMHKHQVARYSYYTSDDERKVVTLSIKEKLKLEKDKNGAAEEQEHED